jgi:dihydroorotate dehydrogenase (fumarate)
MDPEELHMADLSTTYMGLPLSTPLLLASSSISNRVENLQAAEASGAGAVVLRSLFEEQIEAADTELQEALALGSESNPEARTYLPPQRIGPHEYLRLVERAKKALRIPVIASLNCCAPGSWSGYAAQIASAGADALEVNVYSVGADPALTSGDLERGTEEVLASVRSAVRIPVAMKLSPFFTSLANVAARLDAGGAGALVLFNRFLQPDIDLDRLALQSSMQLSEPSEMLLSLRWIALLHGRVKADLAASTGVHDSAGVVKQLLAGAQVVQVASALIRNGLAHLAALRQGLETWMERGRYSTLADFRGTLSQRETKDPRGFERAQYVQLILSQNV